MGAKQKRQTPYLLTISSVFPQFACFMEGRTPYLSRTCLVLRKTFTITVVLPRHIVLNQKVISKAKQRLDWPEVANSLSSHHFHTSFSTVQVGGIFFFFFLG